MPSHDDAATDTGRQTTVAHLLAWLIVAAAFGYLAWFVPRGWVPHDEGLIGQSADLVAQGLLPHVDFQDAYTGGLSQLHAALFSVTGTDLVNARWLAYAAACATLTLVYRLCRLVLPPLGSAAAVWLALTWSFPNYFSALPSWWILACAVVALWYLARYAETGSWSHLVLAGLAAGTSCCLKQTGVYVVAAYGLTICYLHVSRTQATWKWLSRLAAIGAATAAVAVVSARPWPAELVFLAVPPIAVSAALLHRSWADAAIRDAPAAVALLAVAAALLPMGLFLAQYTAPGALAAWFSGAVTDTGQRFARASTPLPPLALSLVSAAPLALAVVASTTRPARWGTWLSWAAAALLPLAATWNLIAYHAIWQLARVLGAAVPVWVAVWSLRASQPASNRVSGPLFAAAAVLAFVSLNQFPYSSGIYFAYTTPLVVVGAAFVTARAGVAGRSSAPWCAMALLFAALSLNPGFLFTLGVRHGAYERGTPLGLPRASLKVMHTEAELYQSLRAAIASHLGDGVLVAGPDCPEVFFLSGRTNPTRVNYEFMARTQQDDAAFDQWSQGRVAVLNLTPEFSPPLSAALQRRIRDVYPHATLIGRYEVRWR